MNFNFSVSFKLEIKRKNKNQIVNDAQEKSKIPNNRELRLRDQLLYVVQKEEKNKHISVFLES